MITTSLLNLVMPSPGKQLYFIALVPPSPIYEEIITLKEYCKEHYHSKASLKSPPHITLHMPFEWKEKKEEKLVQSLQQFSDGHTAFTIQLDNFSSFPPRVIFINVVMSECLTQLQQQLHRHCKKNLNLFNAQYQDLPFHPHLTIAFRDLKKSQYELAWDEFKSRKFSAEFVVDKITLLKHTGRGWKVYKDLDFN
jgi:2'-5' RNA ligase